MITIAGAGLAGLSSALELARRGAAVRVFEANPSIGAGSVSRFAGGMLAPWCERESADEAVVTLGAQAADWWGRITQVSRLGTLVVAPTRDSAELTRFSRRTSAHRAVDQAEITTLEPALAGRFSHGLLYEQEAHLNPRMALLDLAKAVKDLGVEIVLGTKAPAQVDLDCTGASASVTDLRFVRGEMAILSCPEVAINRTVRLLHPRIPLYVVPRGEGVYMIGATMVESTSTRPPTLRSLSELFNAAFTLNPAFAEAAVIETGAGLRPAFPDNLPRLVKNDGRLHFNGLYRHGFLLAPALAVQAAQLILSETSHANHRQSNTANH
ncbi:FAD-dependent oxidoreductase [uncultured Litoreibacter sp.]|uniref:FAD-dependent oxidoreductase n=1 Tax=uncultured Litoreibacter sp. TaxID=1392394 RepID=UPI00262CEF7E|nr:FAD-dependent oxidoreductase [uncultured Litoreibacter sp.]